MKPDNKAGGPWLYALGLVPVIWFALLIAPAISGGLSEIVNALPAAMNHPFKIVWCEDSIKTVLIFIAAYGLGIGIYLSSRRNYRRGEEHGSAKWGDPRAVNKKYRDRDLFKNRIFTQHVRMGLDGRKHRRNLNTLVVGGSGAGKSRFYAKVNICQCNTSFFILDCKGELLRDCGGLLERMGYEIKVVDLLNMEKSHCYGEQNPIVEKSQFVMSLIEQIDKRGVGPQHKSIIDRCTALVYPEAEKSGRVATLCDLRQKLLEQPEDKAREIALSLELYTTGSLDIFGRESTVDLNKPYVVFDIHGLGEQLKPAGSLVITDTILNRVTLNWKRGKRTHVFIDEFHVMFENEQSGIFFNSAWRQFRKRGAYPTAITQNVEYLLDSVQASTMLSNSEFIVMLNQAASDRAKLAKLLNISNEQMSYVTNADAGCGLIRYGSALVPFINRFPRDTRLYALMTTKPGEGVFGGEEVPA